MSFKPAKNSKTIGPFDTGQGGSIARSSTRFLPDGTYCFEDELDMKGDLSATVVTGTAWLLELYDLTAGEVCFESGGEKIYPESDSFGFLYSPFSISRVGFKNAAGHLEGFASTNPLPRKFMAAPLLFGTVRSESPADLEQIVEILTAGRNPRRIEFNSRPSEISLKSKKLIDENFPVYPSIGRIARRIGVTHEHLTRRFKRDFGLSPSEYLHKVRVSEANLRLARGEEIIDVSMDVGYNDLSRFYKQFRKIMEASPGKCRTQKKRR